MLVVGAGAVFLGAEVLSERLYAKGHFAVRKESVRILVQDPHAHVPEEWAAFVAAGMSQLERVLVDDPEGVARVAEKLEGASIFHSVGEPRIVWPDRIEFDVQLRRVVACMKVGDGFIPVAEDGKILPGFSVTPMDDGAGPVPLIAWDEGLALLREGDDLIEAVDYDALSVALSMQRYLSADARARLGSVRIDASGAPFASVTDPGVVVYLSERRAVCFGRAPLSGHPGELPEQQKWEHLERQLRAVSDGGRAWEVLDVRWDRPEVLQWKD